MSTNYVTKTEFRRLEQRVATLEKILQEEKLEEQLKLECHRIRLISGPKYGRASDIVLRSGRVGYVGNYYLLVNGLAIRQLDREGIKYRRIERK